MIRALALYLVLIGFILSAVPGTGEIIINEFLPAPEGDEPEWIELFNPHDSLVSLNGYILTDAAGSYKLNNFAMPAGSFAILTKDTALLKKIRQIPADAIIIENKMPGLNNTWDVITLRKADSSIIDSIYYDMDWGMKGISFERIDWSKPVIAGKNMGPSISSDSATAGFENSIALKKFDLALGSFFTDSNLVLTARNLGRNAVQSHTIYLYSDKNRDKFFSTDEMVGNFPFGQIESGDSASVTIRKDDINEFSGILGSIKLLAYLLSSFDQRRDNDSLVLDYYAPYPRGLVSINEFLFDPAQANAEFIELWNNSDQQIDLHNWKLHDRALSKPEQYLTITKPGFIIQPRSYALVVWDSSIFISFPELTDSSNVFVAKSSMNLNQEGDDIVLLMPSFDVMDSLTYSSEWVTAPISKNISLEKINPSYPSNLKSSWASSSDQRGSTPARENSLRRDAPSQGDIEALPNPFSPYRPGKDNKCTITFSLPFAGSFLLIDIYDINGLKVKSLFNGEATFDLGSVIWDGSNDKGYTVQPGPYILYLEAVDRSKNQVFTRKLMIVLAR